MLWMAKPPRRIFGTSCEPDFFSRIFCTSRGNVYDRLTGAFRLIGAFSLIGNLDRGRSQAQFEILHR